MTELTDLEICKKIAEIEGLDWIVNKYNLVFYRPATCRSHVCLFQPLDDWNVTAKLMNKYGIIYLPLTEGAVARWGEGEDDELSDKNPQRAVCLAIIKQHEAENDKQTMQTVQN